MRNKKKSLLTSWIILVAFHFSSSFADTQQYSKLVAEFLVGFHGNDCLGFTTESGGQGPASLTIDFNNNIYILDNLNHRILVIDSTGKRIRIIDIKSEFGKGGQDIKVDNQGNIYILDKYPPFKPDILQKLGDAKELAKKKPAQLRVYDKNAQQIEIIYLGLNEINYAPNFIWGESAKALSVGFLRRTHKLDILRQIQMSNIKVMYSNVSPAILGTPVNNSDNAFFIFKKDKERTLKDYPGANRFNYIIFEDKFKNFSQVLPPEYSFVQFLYKDDYQNFYIEVSNKNDFVDKNSVKNHREIYKFSNDGELVAKFTFPKNWNSFYTRQFAVSPGGAIYYLYLNDLKNKFKLIRVE